MYKYDSHDQQLVNERVTQYRDQTERFLAGTLSEEQFLPLRLQNGLYVQRLAPMLRVAVPYGLMNSTQLRTIARLARDYDKGYVHISTRQNIQFNWPELAEVPDMIGFLFADEIDAMGYQQFRAERMFVMMPAQAIVADFLSTFKEFPPRQTPASFTIDQVMEKLTPWAQENFADLDAEEDVSWEFMLYPIHGMGA